jgi:RsiW-degrading membrane proteinase PrsW (M82 family)
MASFGDLQIHLGIASAIVGGALLWLIYFDYKDSIHKEPWGLLFAAFGLGAVASLLGLGTYVAIERLGLPAHPGNTPSDIMLYCLLVVGPIEEGCKFAVARAIVFRWRAFDERIDGLVYAAALSIGFATFENFLYLVHLPYLDEAEQLARAATSPLTHSLFAAIWGFGVSRALFDETTPLARWLWQAGSLTLAALLHGFYDGLLLGWNATIPASLTILLVWIVVSRTARRVVRQGSDFRARRTR